MRYRFHAVQSVLFVAILLMGGCASSGSGPVKLGTDGASNIDAVARKVAVDYRSRCYEPIAKRKIPDDLCQFNLFERAERQWGSEFGKSELLQTANKIQGEMIENEVGKLLVYDKASQRYVASQRQTRYEIIQQLKDKYRIN